MTAKKKRDLHYRLTIEADKKSIMQNNLHEPSKWMESGYIEGDSSGTQTNGKVTFMTTLKKKWDSIYQKSRDESQVIQHKNSNVNLQR